MYCTEHVKKNGQPMAVSTARRHKKCRCENCMAHAKQVNKKVSLRRAADPLEVEKRRVRSKTYYENNKEKKAAYHKKWAESNQDKVAEYARNWRSRNPDQVRELTRTRRATKKGLRPDWSTEDKALAAFFEEMRQQAELETGIPHHIDHIMPLAKGGVDHPCNYEVLPATENQSKSDKDTGRGISYDRYMKDLNHEPTTST